MRIKATINRTILPRSVRQNNLLPSGTAPWPPYRIPTECNAAYKDPRCILETRLFHAVIWIILYKAVYVRNISEHVMSLAMYLLEMALAKAHQDSAGFTQVCWWDNHLIIVFLREIWCNGNTFIIHVSAGLLPRYQ